MTREESTLFLYLFNDAYSTLVENEALKHVLRSVRPNYPDDPPLPQQVLDRIEKLNSGESQRHREGLLGEVRQAIVDGDLDKIKALIRAGRQEPN